MCRICEAVLSKLKPVVRICIYNTNVGPDYKKVTAGKGAGCRALLQSPKQGIEVLLPHFCCLQVLVSHPRNWRKYIPLSFSDWKSQFFLWIDDTHEHARIPGVSASRQIVHKSSSPKLNSSTSRSASNSPIHDHKANHTKEKTKERIHRIH